MGRSLMVCVRDAQVVVQTFLSDALAPAIAFDLLDMVLILLAVCKTLVAVHLVFVVLLLLMVMLLLDGLVLFESALLL
jgi:hypothetical protein